MLRPRRDVQRDSGTLRGWGSKSRSRSQSASGRKPPVQVRNTLSLKPRQKVILKGNSNRARSVTPSSRSEEDDRRSEASYSGDQNNAPLPRRRAQNVLDTSPSRADGSEPEQKHLARACPADNEGREVRRRKRRRRVKVLGEENTGRERKHRKRRKKELATQESEPKENESRTEVANGKVESQLKETDIPGVSAKAKARRRHKERAEPGKDEAADAEAGQADVAPAPCTQAAEGESDGTHTPDEDSEESKAVEDQVASEEEDDKDEERQDEEDGDKSDASDAEEADKERASASRASASKASGDHSPASRAEEVEKHRKHRRSDKDRKEKKRKEKDASREARLDKKDLKKVKQRAELLIQKSKDKARDKKSGKKNEWEVSQLRALIRGVYERRNPTKLAEFESVMKKYAGSEAEVYKHVCQKYGETPVLPTAAKVPALPTSGKIPAITNGSELSKSKAAKPGFAKKASAPAPPATLRVVPKVGPCLSPPRPIPSAAELFAAVEASKGNYESSWPFVGEEDEPNSPSSSSSSPERDMAYRGLTHYGTDMGSRYFDPHTSRSDPNGLPPGMWYRPHVNPQVPQLMDTDMQSHSYPGASSHPGGKRSSHGKRGGEVDMYADLLNSAPLAKALPPPPPAMPRSTNFERSPPRVSRYDPPTPGAFRPAAQSDSRGSNSAPIELSTFLGDWRDSMRHNVVVQWARSGNRGGQLDVLLSKPGSDREPIRLNVKQSRDGRFECGHYDLDLEQSNHNQIVWRDLRSQGKVSYWNRVRS